MYCINCGHKSKCMSLPKISPSHKDFCKFIPCRDSEDVMDYCDTGGSCYSCLINTRLKSLAVYKDKLHSSMIESDYYIGFGANQEGST